MSYLNTLLDNQEFSERTLKGALLQNVDLKTKNPTIQTLNHFLVKRVDEFWDTVVIPLKKLDKFDGNKIKWYFNVYKEGIDAHKLNENPFTFINISNDEIAEIVKFYKDKTLTDYINLGNSYLTNTYTLLTSAVRDHLMLYRMEHIYNSSEPYEWILKAEEEEHGAMEHKGDLPEGVENVLQNIGLLMSKRV